MGLLYRPTRAWAGRINSLESIPGLLKRFQIQAQATLASGIGSLELIPGLFKHLQIRAQATLDSGIVSLESIPGLHKSFKNTASVRFTSIQFVFFASILPISGMSGVCSASIF
jgi:hypothetical protein